MTAKHWTGPKAEVQKLALWGYPSHASRHIVLSVRDGAAARRFIAALLKEDLIDFGDRPEELREGLDIGFTFAGLEALGLPTGHQAALASRSRAFCEGARSRAARRLGDTGASAAEHWDPMFEPARAELLISIHADNKQDLASKAARLRELAGDALDGWKTGRIDARHLGEDDEDRRVHFGFRDNLSRQEIADKPTTNNEKPERFGEHHAGELLIGYRGDDRFDRWRVADQVNQMAREFFVNGSFAALRVIQQHEGAFNDYLDRQCQALQDAGHGHVSRAYLKAKLCGRWPDGAVVRPGKTHPPANQEPEPEPDFAFQDDREGLGCPFGAHIRRTNPRDDPLSPPQLRPLFRRGMPYGKEFSKDTKDEDRGLVGLFFCASLDEQFEVVMSEWVENSPMGPPGRGRAKDPLIGHHDDPEARFHIPQGAGRPDLVLDGFTEPFVRTRGTLYLLYPSRTALRALTAFDGGRQGAPAPSHRVAPGSASAARPPRDETDSAPVDRYCDLVMEGGVTSGVIYTTAAARLATAYRFQSIGGSSIGCFAAALTAAAEYSRRHGSMKGFKFLETLPDELAREERGRTLLLRLFRPQPGLERLFKVFLAGTGHESRASATRSVLREIWRQYRPKARWTWFAVAIAWVALLAPLAWSIGTGRWQSWSAQDQFSLMAWTVAGVLLLVMLLLVLVGVVTAVGKVVCELARDLRRLPANGFGLCRGGLGRGADGTPDLAEFLHQALQRAAGRDVDDPPLTFGHLWAAPGGPRDVLGDSTEGARHSINLVLYATNLAYGRPCRFPDPGKESDDTGRLYFRRQDLADYFPRSVLDALVRTAPSYHPANDACGPEEVDRKEGWLTLPAADLPVVVAVRIALSFPFLVSAVPLGAVNRVSKSRDERRIETCWMSDGGLCTNFPIHLFDSFVPRWPTFGISLQDRVDGSPEVWLPDRHDQGRDATRHAEMDDKLRPGARLWGFVTGMVLATWRWNDLSTLRLPGVRDRVVRVFLAKDEGGVNLKMGKPKIDRLAGYGRKAADALLVKFATGGPGWPEHRWVRLNRLLATLGAEVEGLSAAIRHAPHSQDLVDAIREASTRPPLRGENAIAPAEVKRLQRLVEALEALERAMKQQQPLSYEAQPRPKLLVRPPI